MVPVQFLLIDHLQNDVFHETKHSWKANWTDSCFRLRLENKFRLFTFPGQKNLI